ncbi:PUS3-like protein [Mya arenaria]|uniref:tRNA pseudouridine synthase n=1 Tax=Mya arenaria TaxID=6604 RepID=A0ABY7DJB8_MYAAR|nr:PUS3-like protein [Mya arenaria]
MLQELMLRIRQLETHVKVLQRASKEEDPVHHVALTIMYLGHDYTGYDDTEEVVSLDVRGNLLSGVGVKVREGMSAHERPDGITNYVRKIMEVEVKTLDETDDGFTMCELTIVGRAFLWHQIRSIFSVLFLVGKGKESVEDESSEEEMTSRKRQRLEIDKPSHIDDKPFGTLDKPKSGENKDPHIIYGKNNKEDDDTVRDIDGEIADMKADKDICGSKTSLKDNGEENLETSENGMKGGEKVTSGNDTDQFDREHLTTNTEVNNDTCYSMTYTAIRHGLKLLKSDVVI